MCFSDQGSTDSPKLWDFQKLVSPFPVQGLKNFRQSWTGPKFEILSIPGPVWSDFLFGLISYFVLVGDFPSFIKFLWSWSKSVLDFAKFSRSSSGSVHGGSYQIQKPSWNCWYGLEQVPWEPFPVPLPTWNCLRFGTVFLSERSQIQFFRSWFGTDWFWSVEVWL